MPRSGVARAPSTSVISSESEDSTLIAACIPPSLNRQTTSMLMKKPAARETNNKSAAANDGPPTSRDVAFPGEWVCKSSNVRLVEEGRRIRYKCGDQKASAVVMSNAPIPTEMLQRVALKRRVLPRNGGGSSESSGWSNLSSRNLFATGDRSRSASMYPSIVGATTTASLSTTRPTNVKRAVKQSSQSQG